MEQLSQRRKDFLHSVAASIKDAFLPIMVVLLFLAVMGWAVCILQLEDKMIACRMGKEPRLQTFSFWLLTWVACFTILMLHAAILSGRIG